MRRRNEHSARGRVGEWQKKGKHRNKIPKAQVNRRPDLQSLPTARARGALGVSDPEEVREWALQTQDFAAGVGRRRRACAVAEGAKKRSGNKGGTVRFKIKAEQSKRSPTRAQRLYFGPFLYVSTNESYGPFLASRFQPTCSFSCFTEPARSD